MNATPYCVGLFLFYLPLLSVLGMSSTNLLPYLIFTYRSTRSISAPPLIICRVPHGPRCPPVSGSVRIVITVCSTARTLVRPLSAGRFSINLFSSVLFLQLCSSFGRRAFLHHLDYHLLIVMDNNVLVCGHVHRVSSSALRDG